MPKKKKTKKQKILAEKRHIEYKPLTHKSIPNAQAIDIPTQPKQEPAHTIATKQYSYLFPDLRKTIILTSAIILIEILLAYFKFGAH